MKQRQSTPDAGISIDASDTAQSMRNEATISDAGTNAPCGETSPTRALTVGGNATDGRLTILAADGNPIADMQAATANPRRQDIELALGGAMLRVKEIRDKGAAAVSVTTIPAGEVATAGVIGAAPVAKTVIRDRLELTHDFIASLELPPQPAPTSTVRFVARDIVVNAPGDLSLGVLIENYHVDVIADTVDLRDGIWATAPLSPADPQVKGIDGPDIRVLCRELRGAGLISFGQTGGAGTKGEDGTRATFKSDFNEQTGNIECFMVRPPGAGKDGGPGATGGDSGQISLAYVLDSVPGGFTPGSLLPGGGGGGEGGEGGGPGAVDPPHSSCDGPDEPAPSGNRGPAGTDGSAKPVQVAVLTSEQYLAALHTVLGEAMLDAWIEHRFQAADYYFRAFRPEGPTSNYLTLARDEANAIIALAPGSEWADRATTIRDNILNNLNVLSLPRDYTLQTPPEFTRLNNRLYAYEEPVNNFFRSATQGLLLADLAKAGVLEVLGTEKGRLEDPAFVQQLLAETEAAAADKTAAATNLNTANSRIEQLKKEIADLEYKISTELPASDLKLSNGLTLAAGTVVVMAATMFAPPAAGAAAAALMPLAADLLGNSGMSADIKTIFGSSKDLSQALHLKVEETKPNAKGLNEFSKDYGKDQEKAEKDWKDPALKIALSFAKITKNLIDIANIKDPREVELVKKYQELMAATHQQFLAQLGSSAAEFRHTAALAADQLRVNDVGRVNEAITEVKKADGNIRRAVVTAVRNARPLRHQLLLRVFEAARALDLYTLRFAPAGITPVSSPYVDLNNPVSLVAYDYGYLHPDVEAHYIDETIDHTQFKSQLEAKMQTIESMGYDDTYEAYRRRGTGGMVGEADFTFPQTEDERKAAVKAFREGYDLRLMSVAAADGLADEGRNLVIVALVGTDLHIRIFDASGKKVIDKAENELISGETLTNLKKQLNPLPDESGLSQEQKQKFIRDATSIAGHTLREEKRFFVKIDAEEIWGLRHEAKVTGLSLRLDGVKVRAPFSCKVWHYGRSQQRILPSENHNPPVVEQLLPLSDDFITMRIAPGAPTAPGALTAFAGSAEVIDPADGRVKLRSWGRGVAAEWMVEIEPGTGDVDLSKLTDIAFSIEYDSFEEDATPETPSLRSVRHAVGTIQPGATSHAAVVLTAPAPADGLAIKLTTSNAAAVKVPGGVMVPAGAMTATIPMESPATAAGQSATITATSDFTIRTTVRVPAQTMATTHLNMVPKPDVVETAYALAVDETYAYATLYLSKEENPKESLAEGELIRIRHADFKEQLPRIKLGFQPRSMAINPNLAVNCIYVVNYAQESYSLTILDRGTLKEIASSPLKLGQGPIDVAVNTKTNRVYVTNWFQRRVHVIEMTDPVTKAHTVVAEVKAPEGAEPLTGWGGITVDERNNRIYGARNYHSGGTPNVDAVAVIDGKTNQVARTITHPELHFPVDVAVNATGTRLYVAMFGNPDKAPGVAVFDIDRPSGIATYRTTIRPRSNPTAVVANHQRNQVYVSIASGVQIIDADTLTVVSTTPIGKYAQSVVVSPAAGRLYVGDAMEGTVTSLSVPDLETIATWS